MRLSCIIYELLYERIRLSGLDMSGPCDRYLASFPKGQIARIGGLEGPGTYGLTPTHSCGEAKWASSKFDPRAPNFDGNKSLWLIFVTCLVKFTTIHIVYRAIHEDRSVFPEKSATLGFCGHISPHPIFWKRGVGWAVDDVTIALVNFVLNKNTSMPDGFHSFSCRKTATNF